MKAPDRKAAETVLSTLVLLVVLYPELRQPRVWWWLAMRSGQEGARRLGQLAILAEQQYRKECA